jgi:hypothetical protein
VGKLEEKRQLERHSHKWKDHVTMDLKEIGLKVENLITLAHDRDQWLVKIWVL